MIWRINWSFNLNIFHFNLEIKNKLPTISLIIFSETFMIATAFIQGQIWNRLLLQWPCFQETVRNYTLCYEEITYKVSSRRIWSLLPICFQISSDHKSFWRILSVYQFQPHNLLYFFRQTWIIKCKWKCCKHWMLVWFSA